MGKKKTTTTTNQTQTSAPPTWTAPGLADAAGRVTAGMSQIPTTHYSGPMVATMDPQDLAAIQAAWRSTAGQSQDYAQMLDQWGMPLLQQGMDFSTSLPSTAYSLAPRQELDSVIAASIDPVQRQLMEQILPSITNSALMSGAYSGDRAMGVLPQTAIQDATDSMQRIAAQLGYEDYQNYENRRLAAYQAETGAAQQNYALETQRETAEAVDRLQRLGLAPEYINSILRMGASSGDLLRMAAELEVANAQAGYDNAIAMDQYASQAPFMGLDTASTLLARLSGNYGTQNMNGTSTTTQSSPLIPQLIQGALGVGSMIAGFPGAGAALGGLVGAGGGAGAASSLFAPLTMPPVSPVWNSNPFVGMGG